MTYSAFHSHNHARCVEATLSDVQRECARRSLRLTRLRQRVLEILLEAHRALAAYDILAKLAKEGFSAQPPTVYRALDFLVTNGFSHKIQSVNAYIVCSHTTSFHTPLFLICRSCETVAEEAVKLEAVRDIVPFDKGFQMEESMIEIYGLCPRCRGGAQ